MINNSMKKFNGFTLVELMVVMAIISFLTVGAYAGLTFALRQGRDTSRIRIVDQIQTALIAYYSDYNEYPGCGGYSGSRYLVDGISSGPVSLSFGQVYCVGAFDQNGVFVTTKGKGGLANYFEGEFQHGQIPLVNSETDLRYYIKPKVSNKGGQDYTVCVKLENPVKKCYCVGSGQDIACEGMEPFN